MEKPIENIKNLAYVHVFQPERLPKIEAVQTEKYAMLKEIDEDIINTVKSKVE
jgi:hypothetical protein